MTLNFDGAKYKQASSQQKAWGVELIRELDLVGNERIVDLGCGDGALTAELARLVPDGSVLGIDASASMIETARKDHTGTNLRFELCDINAIAFESEFDVVFSNAALHWVKDHRKLLTNVDRSLKDRGVARFQFAGEGNCPTLIAVLRETMSERDYADCFDGFEWPWYMPGVNQYRELLDKTTFSEKKVWSQTADKYFDSVKAMTGWIDEPSLVPFLGQMAEKDRPRFRNAVVERMVERARRADGTCLEKFRRINVLARSSGMGDRRLRTFFAFAI